MHRLRTLAAVGAVFGAVALTVIAPAGATAGQSPHVEYCHSWAGYTKIHWDRNELQARYGTGVVKSVRIHWQGPFQGDHFVFKMDNENYETVTPVWALSVDSFTLALDNGAAYSFETYVECK